MIISVALLCVLGAEPSGALTRAPELQHFVDAAYPPEDFAAHRGAEVTMDVDIDETGKVTAARKSSVALKPPPATPDSQAEERFARAAEEAATHFLFSPAEIDGKPAPVRITYRYHFTIREEAPKPAAGAVSIEGVVLERGTRKPLALASVAVEGGPTAMADERGRFALRGVATGHHIIRVIASDHDPFQTHEEVRDGEKTKVTYYLHRQAVSAYETVVQGEREQKEVAKSSLSLEEIKRVPGTSGDAVAVVQTLPGVARAPYGLGLLPVRGTLPGDTVGYLDGISIPSIFHFGDLPISVVNADALSGIDFYPGNFSARFGRALGGTVELRGRSGASEGVHGYGDISFIDAKALVETPTSENGSLLVTARRSYVDLVLSTAGVDSISPRYYDYLVRHDWKLKGGRAAVYAYGSSDSLTLNFKSGATANPEDQQQLNTSTQFHRLQGLYEKSLGDHLSTRVVGALGYDDMNFNFGTNNSAHAEILSLQLRAEANYEPSKFFQLTLGVDSMGDHISYSVNAPTRPTTTQISGCPWTDRSPLIPTGS